MHKKKKQIKKEVITKAKKIKIDKAKERARITAFIKYFSSFFGLQNYEIKVVFKEEIENGNLAEIVIEEDYQRIKVDVMAEFFKETRIQQSKTLMHELAHSVCWGLYSIAWDMHNGKLHTKDNIRFQNEKATSIIENIVHKSLTMDLSKEKKEYEKYHRK